MSTSANLFNQPVAMIGLGLMGQAFTQQLDAAKVPLIGFDVNPQACEQFGLHRTADLVSIAKQASIFILSVFSSAQVEETLLGKNSLSDLAQNKPITAICTSTCDPDHLKDIATRFEALGHYFLELPISGTSAQLARTEALGLIGGSEVLADRLGPLLDIILPQRQYIGAIGDAGKAKLAINLVLGLHRAALAEGLCFGRKLGLDPEKLLATLQQSAAASSVMKIKGPLMVNRTYDQPQSKVNQSLKDFGLIAHLGAQLHQHLPLTEIYIQLLESQLSKGLGHLDNAIIHEAIAENVLAHTSKNLS